MKTYIYIIENCFDDPNKIYVGKTKKKGSRKAHHKERFGYQVTHTTIDEIDSLNKEEWKSLETYWINQFRVWGFDVQNKNNGGGGCLIASKEMRLKISKANSGKIRTEEHKKKYRGPKTQEHKNNMSLVRVGVPSNKKGKKYGTNSKISTPERNAKISQSLQKSKPWLNRIGKQKKGREILDISTGLTYDSILRCCEATGINKNKMNKLIREGKQFK